MMKFVFILVALCFQILTFQMWSPPVSAQNTKHNQGNPDGNHCEGIPNWQEARNRSGFTKEQKCLVDLHNAHRSLLNPPAADVLEMFWDSKIAEFAQEHVDLCTGGHREDRNMGRYTMMGENLYIIPGHKFNSRQAVSMWMAEKRDYNIEENTCTHVYTCMHYIAAVWASSNRMGCGVRLCESVNGKPLTKSKIYLICNYSGSVYGYTRPYKVGTPCSACPKRLSQCRYNMCVSKWTVKIGRGFNGNTKIIE